MPLWGTLGGANAPAPHDNPPVIHKTSLLPFLAWPRPDRALLRGEALAGLTVGLMVIPQGVAYAALAGMPLVTGIYASMLPALVAVLFSASVRLSVGPTALSCLLIASGLGPLAQPGSPQWIALAVWLALLSGLLQVALGFMRFGWLLNLVNTPVLMGFTQAAALLIIGSQLKGLLGVDTSWQGWWAAPQIHGPSLAFGLGSLVLLYLAQRWRPAFPSVLLVVLGSAGLAWATGYEAGGGRVVGPVPAGLPALYWPHWPGLETLGQLVLPTLVLTLVSFLETASSAKVDSEAQGRRWDQNQDLIGQGLGKITAGLSGAFPTSSSFSRSALNLYAGAQTGWATVFSVAVVFLALLVFTPVLRHVPQPVLAAIVLVAVVGLVRPRGFVRLWRIARVEAVTAFATFAITLLAAPQLYWGVLAGVLMALSHFLYQRLHPRIIEVGLHPDGSLRDRHLWQIAPLAPRVLALRMDAELDFASANALERRVADELAQRSDIQHLCLFALPINRIDVTGVEAFMRLRALLQSHGGMLHVSGIKLPVQRTLENAGALAPGPNFITYRTDAEAIAALQQTAAENSPA